MKNNRPIYGSVVPEGFSFDPSKIAPVQEGVSHLNKPIGGFWGSSYSNGTTNWKSHIEREGMDKFNHSGMFKFRMKEGANVLSINTPDDLNKLDPYIEKASGRANAMMNEGVNFNKLSKDFDGMYISQDAIDANRMDIGSKGTYAWDVESMVVFNGDAVEPYSRPSRGVARASKNKGGHNIANDLVQEGGGNIPMAQNRRSSKEINNEILNRKNNVEIVDPVFKKKGRKQADDFESVFGDFSPSEATFGQGGEDATASIRANRTMQTDSQLREKFANKEQYRQGARERSRQLDADNKAAANAEIAAAKKQQAFENSLKGPSDSVRQRYANGERAYQNADVTDRFGGSRKEYINKPSVEKPMRNAVVANQMGNNASSSEALMGNIGDALDLRSDWKKGFDNKLDGIKTSARTNVNQAKATMGKPINAVKTNITAMKDKVGKGLYEFNNPLSDITYEESKIIKQANKQMAEQTAETAAKKGAKEGAENIAKGLTKTKVGRIAAAVGVGALVVSNMNKNKGQQTNGQLYGQQAPYSY